MSTKWLDRTQPQTLYIATMLMYFNAALSLLFVAAYSNVSLFGIRDGLLFLELVLIAGQVAGGFGIANEKRWGYVVAVATAVVLLLSTLFSFTGGGLLSLIFEIALVALLLHPQSREYRRIWFR
jgi:hypothetical protein